MSYFFTKSLNTTFDDAIETVTAKLKEHGFGVLTEIDVQATFKKKLDKDYYNYKILGACNPHFAFQALQHEDKIGTMLPCNVIVQQKKEGGPVEVSAVDPVASMLAVKNSALGGVANQVRAQLEQTITSL